MSWQWSLVLLLLLVALYLLTLGTGHHNRDQTAPNMDGARSSLVNGLGFLRGLAPEAVAGGQCARQPLNRVFTLSATSPSCSFRLHRPDSTKFAKAKLDLVPGTDTRPPVFMRTTFKEATNPKSERNRRLCRFTRELPAFHLAIDVKPDHGGPSGNTWTCWYRQNVPVTLLLFRSDATVDLNCTGCETTVGVPRSIRLVIH